MQLVLKWLLVTSVGYQLLMFDIMFENQLRLWTLFMITISTV